MAPVRPVNAQLAPINRADMVGDVDLDLAPLGQRGEIDCGGILDRRTRKLDHRHSKQTTRLSDGIDVSLDCTAVGS
jgi:hypothetical protein